MCGFARGHYRRSYRDAENWFIVVVTMIREAIAVLARARRELETLSNSTGFTETHINVPL